MSASTIARAPITDEELERWAGVRADDAGHLARELIGYRRSRVLANPCIQKLEDGEPFFVLLGRDKHAAIATRVWAEVRDQERGVTPKTTEARQIASEMEAYAQNRASPPLRSDMQEVKEALERIAAPAPTAAELDVPPGVDYWSTVATRRQDIARAALTRLNTAGGED